MRIRRITHYKDVVILSTNGGLLTFSDLFKKPQCIHFYKTVRRQGDNGSLLSDDVLQTLVTSRGKVFVNTMGGGFQELAANNLLADQLPLKNVDAVSDKEGQLKDFSFIRLSQFGTLIDGGRCQWRCLAREGDDSRQIQYPHK